jgi:hypothetical protein
VHPRAFAASSFVLGLALALGGASCGPTCPAGQQSCGNSDASAGSSSDAGGTGYNADTCGLLTAMKKCMTAYCATASNPFCTCYKRGYDLTTSGCVCVDFDAKKFCDQAEAAGNDGRAYDCGAASSGVSSYCVGVK